MRNFPPPVGGNPNIHVYEPGETVLGGLLRAQRRKLAWTQERAAAMLDVRPQTLAAWERGGRPQPRFYERIAAFLELDGPDAVVRLVDPASGVEGPTVAEDDEPDDGLTPRQRRVVDAVTTRLVEGSVSETEAVVMRELLKAVGLSPDVR